MNLEKEYFDVVTARNTPTDPKQIYNVLKPGGYLIIRGVDKYDCYDLLRTFKQKESNDKPISITDYEAVLDAGFKDVELIPIHEREYFKDEETLYNFLLKVPILSQECSKEIDRKKLKEYISKNTYPQGIRLFRRYYGIVAKK